SMALARLRQSGAPRLVKDENQSRRLIATACDQKLFLMPSSGATGPEVADYRAAVDEACRTRDADPQPVGPPSPVDAARVVPGMTPPRRIKDVPVRYPRNGGEEGPGFVTLDVTIGPEGTVTEVVPLRSTDPRFEAPAIDAARQWQFTPARLDGEPMPVV